LAAIQRLLSPLALAALAGWPAIAQDASISGAQLYAQRCASCHGADLEGQPDWMVRKPDGKLPAPPHDETGHTWHHSDRQLLQIVREGLASIAPGYATDMPAYDGQLSEPQILAILDYIKSNWPERQRAFQAARSAADPVTPM
jgi:mono/diheme cytochrome c family protein